MPSGASHRTRIIDDSDGDPVWDESFGFGPQLEPSAGHVYFKLYDADPFSHDYLAGGEMSLSSCLTGKGEGGLEEIALKDSGGSICGMSHSLPPLIAST